MDGLKKLISKLKKEKRIMVIAAAGVAAIILLLLSELVPEKNEISEQPEKQKETTVDYALETEKKLEGLLSSIEGAGKAKVMVTLESSAETVFAADTDTENDSANSPEGDAENRTKFNEEYIIIKSSSDGETGLILKVIQPKIRGVAIVCEGAESATVRKNITDAVTAVLGIGTDSVSVAKGVF